MFQTHVFPPDGEDLIRAHTGLQHEDRNIPQRRRSVPQETVLLFRRNNPHQPMSLIGQPALTQPPRAGTRCRLSVSLLSRIRSDQLAGRTSPPPDGGHAQGLGRKPHGQRSPDAKHLAPHPANLPPAESPGVPVAKAPPVFPSTPSVGFDDFTATLNKYLFSCQSIAKRKCGAWPRPV